MNIGDIILGLAGIVIGASQVKKGMGNVAKGQTGGGNLGVLGPARQGGERTPPTQVVHLAGNRYSTLSSPPVRAAKSEMKTKIRGVNSLDDRMAAIIEMGHRGKSEPSVVEWTRNAVTQRCGGNWCTPEKDTMAEIRAIYGALRQDIRYTSDIRGLDTYANPKHTLRMRSGDCLPGETLLVTLEGPKRIDQVEVGDLIVDGTDWVSVLNWWDKGTLPVKRFSFENGKSLTCTDAHKVFLASGEEVLAASLSTGQSLLQPKGSSGATIVAIEQLDPCHVYDIETESGRIYLPESDIIVHNCDDYASLGFAALASVGIPVRYKVIRTVDSDDWNHIYIQAGTSKSDPKSWVSLDASVPAQAGWEAPANMVAESRIYETE